MSNDTTTYNGWTNYETWCVHLWLTNDEGSYRYWREEAMRCFFEAPEYANVSNGLWTVGQTARYTLRDALKESFQTFHPFRGEHLAKPREPDVFCDLLDAALSEVNWCEIAEAFLEDLVPDDEPDGDHEGEHHHHDIGEHEAASLENFERAKRERAESPAGPLFELGRVVSTPGALATLTPEDIGNALGRHHRGDWGDVGQSDWEENEASLKEGFRLFSVYRSQKDEKFWVITEADRSSTCVLLPSEY